MSTKKKIRCKIRLHLCVQLILKVIYVQTTFCLLSPLPPTRPFAFTFNRLLCAMPVPDTCVSLQQQCVDRNEVCGGVLIYLLITPETEWVQFQETLGVNFERLQGSTCGPLRGTPTSYDRLNGVHFVSTLRRLDLAQTTSAGR
jgi:hypothetical protein